MKNLLKSILLMGFIFINLAGAAVNLNSASEQEIEALPGVGPKMATAIIQARPFKSIDDLKNVKGVGNAKFDKLKTLVSVDGQAAAPAVANTPPNPVAAVTNTATAKTSEAKTIAAKGKLAAGTLININTASPADLAKLPGIGPKKADAIVAGRPFSKPEDIMKVKGIKEGVYKKIASYISVN